MPTNYKQADRTPQHSRDGVSYVKRFKLRVKGYVWLFALTELKFRFPFKSSPLWNTFVRLRFSFRLVMELIIDHSNFRQSSTEPLSQVLRLSLSQQTVSVL